MNVLIVYCHPSTNSFTHSVKEEFIQGLQDAGHRFEISDLYEMRFNPVLSEEEYRREGFYDDGKLVPDEVKAEQEKLNRADAAVFIYPVFWTEAPALLTGWFQRVWTYGFAYGDSHQMKQLQKALFLVTMGGSLKDSVRLEQVEAMKTVMIGDRIHQRAKSSQMIIFDEMTRGYGNDEHRAEKSTQYLRRVYQLGYGFESLR